MTTSSILEYLLGNGAPEQTTPVVLRAERIERVYQAIASYINQHGYAPTMRELCALCQVPGTATMYSVLQSLREQGRIDYTEGKARTIRLLKGANQ